MNISPIKLGLVFTGWGVLVAVFAVAGAPRLQARFGIAVTMYFNLATFAAVILVIAIWTTDRAVLISAVIASGIFIGVNNTITTPAVMTIAPVERPVASAAYSFVRFIGGSTAPCAAGRLVIALNIQVPFFIAAGAVAAGIVILSSIHRQLAVAERVQAEEAGSDAHGAPAGPGGRVVPVPGVAAARRADNTTTGVGQILLHAADHGAAGRMVAEYANDVGATTIVIGAPTHGGLSELIDASSSKELLRTANSNALIINPAAPRASSLRPRGSPGRGTPNLGLPSLGSYGPAIARRWRANRAGPVGARSPPVRRI
jgi:MFS transporter, ACDE family, multidrug resistance protein